MDVGFADPELDRLETDLRFTAGLGVPIVKGFRKAMQLIRAASDERDLYALRGLNFEKLSGSRAHQHSIRINKQWRLILELQNGSKTKVVRVIEINDYH
jgi:proteic killer suppression protein